ncbi:hypothetical protein JOL79_18980 [Microbispora sp. RL4-1S]|uniref:DUF5666 domain-containing protein n=1 Tax=Microbispora oryzae TaxID=2806554 RepID=A0A940WRW8_9ACTN|nr:hypothetical protein [Microbispora oryzae]MBP2705894.1 hypothetical protein [Microbispora oryzae]
MTDPRLRPHLPGDLRPSPRRLMLGVAAALAVATGAGVTTAATSGQPQHATAQHLQPSPGPNGGPGSYQTFTSQTGTVSAVQQNSITVTGDGGSRTYAVDENTRVFAGPGGLNGVKSGDTVWVVGTPQGNPPRAMLLVDVSRPQWPGATGGGTAPAQPSPPTQPTPPPPGQPAPPPESGPEGSMAPSGPESPPETIEPTE